MSANLDNNHVALLFLLEAKTDYLADKLGDKLLQTYQADTGAARVDGLETNLHVVEYIESELTNMAYLEWVTRKYVVGQFSLEDVPNIDLNLVEFDRIKPRLPNKDINQFKTVQDLYAKIDEFGDVEVKSGKEKAREVKNEFYSPEQDSVKKSGQAALGKPDVYALESFLLERTIL